jgi:hypothetical protein
LERGKSGNRRAYIDGLARAKLCLISIIDFRSITRALLGFCLEGSSITKHGKQKKEQKTASLD